MGASSSPKKWLTATKSLLAEEAERTYGAATTTTVHEERAVLAEHPALLTLYDRMLSQVHSPDMHRVPAFVARTFEL